jgi:hypothetical protein
MVIVPSCPPASRPAGPASKRVTPPGIN